MTDDDAPHSQLEEHLNLLFAVEAVHHPLSDPLHPAHKKTFLVWKSGMKVLDILSPIIWPARILLIRMQKIPASGFGLHYV